MCVSARPRSNSYMPDSKMALTVKRFMRGWNPAGVALPSGAMSTTLSPDLHGEFLAPARCPG